MRKLSAGIIVAVLLCGVAHAASAPVTSGVGHVVAAWGCSSCGQSHASTNWHMHWGHWGHWDHNSGCGCGCKCCPQIPEYPMVCMHDHRDLHRDLCSRQHAPWW